jgi:hypothetical protein
VEESGGEWRRVEGVCLNKTNEMGKKNIGVKVMVMVN